jgi:hypothetical protein
MGKKNPNYSNLQNDSRNIPESFQNIPESFQIYSRIIPNYSNSRYKWPRRPDSKKWPKVQCLTGWDYDRSEYKDTLVTEVSQQF